VEETTPQYKPGSRSNEEVPISFLEFERKDEVDSKDYGSHNLGKNYSTKRISQANGKESGHH